MIKILPSGWLLLSLIAFWILIGFVSCQLVSAEEYTLDQWADAIYIAEGKEKAVVPYGMFFNGCDWNNIEYCRKIVKNTIYNTLIKYRSNRCKSGESDISCLQRRYCPLNDPRDVSNLNKNWQKNVLYYLKHL